MCPAGPDHPVPGRRDPSKIAARLIGEPLAECRPMSLSGNSRVWRVVTRTGQILAAKVYPDLAVDPRQRLAREVAALRFLATAPGWPFDIPAVIGFDADAQVGLYSWIEGAAVGQVTPNDIAGLAAAMAALRQISALETARTIGDSVEATLSADTLLGQINQRQTTLLGVAGDSPELAALLEGDFADGFASGRRALERLYAMAGLSLTDKLAEDKAVLSPSDFGLHNSLRLRDGRLAFLDFEYFGWDDPVRLVVDVLCHPAMALDVDQRRAFLAMAVPVFVGDPTFSIRLEAMAPLIALRWALIVLNEFIPTHWRRRVEAGMSEPWAEAKARQIRKARGLIALGRSFQNARWT